VLTTHGALSQIAMVIIASQLGEILIWFVLKFLQWSIPREWWNAPWLMSGR